MENLYFHIPSFFFTIKDMKEPVRLLMLTHNYPRFEDDYAGVFLSVLARRLPDEGIIPVVLAPHHPGTAEYEELHGVKIYRFRYAKKDDDENLAYRGNMHKLVLGSIGGVFKFKNFLDCFRKAAFDVIARENIQVVAGHWLIPAGMVMKTIAKKQNLPMILSSHGTDIRLMSKYMQATYRYLKKFCYGLKRWTVVSNYLKDEIVRLDPSLENIISVLPLPHDETIFFHDKSTIRDKNLITSVTRFTEQKRVDYLIKAMALVIEKNPEARLEIYGTGDLQKQIEDLIRKFGLETTVNIFPPVSQEKLREIYNRSGVVVLNSYREGFGLALSEAMLCGAAVIGTNSGGIPDIIKNERTGLLVEPDNSQALAEAVLNLLSDNALREKLSSDGHRFARENYASGPLAGKYASIVKAAVDDSKSD